MKKANNYLKESENDLEKTLFVSCSDSLDVCARVTFDSCVVDGVQVTFWMEDSEDIDGKLDSIFDVLFKETIKNNYYKLK
ncbi:hypothetical protein A3A95_04065 [Candidatus Nomurabacteria bacterium RIFCSPLOWO2_01_FULL_39_18]|uniref:Uncharacterized protein n=1 Tax=Candidatus Nomurabacteria bacterium RIFCSPHIGHO2_01_FULL_40_24b TaxID=1801739 RepID=A0A1F6V6G7_9BACT|nr:MAG: hypothetical protein A2647_04455 [Candidatus Nomurabacteria bacterium RIFCSPHIGHO2_01_FULL_40_24b]OGI89276.1 MAG: hypothetical protein A3A95_04065 [Candidatus Nomurabacteria bacterium RIFCSPLOWO2_01_FULL_39_18]